MRIPFGPFEPDKSPFSTAVSGNIVNAQPVANGWAPLPGLSVISDALPAECRGAVYTRSSDGTTTIIAATATHIYKLNTADYSWDDISGASAPYNLGVGDSWWFTVFGPYLLIHNIADPIQVYNIESGGTCSDLAGSPPQAKYSWVSGDFLVLGYLNDATGARKVRWSGVNNIEFWDIGSQGADEQELPDGGEVMAGVPGNGGFYVITRHAMHFFAFSPSSGYTFTRTTVNPQQGVIAPRSVVTIGPGDFLYLSEDGFFRGPQRQPIGAERVDRWYADNVDPAYNGETQGALDPYEKIVWWKYRLTNGSSRRLGYDWQLDRWLSTDVDVGEIVAVAVPDISWDGLDNIYASIDDVTEPFDSRLFFNGRPAMATFDSSNRLCFFTGGNLQATLQTNLAEPAPPSRAFCRGARVTTDATTYTVTDTVYPYHGANGTTSAASSMNRAGFVPLRADGRLHQFTLTIPENQIWTIVSDVDAMLDESGQQ